MKNKLFMVTIFGCIFVSFVVLFIESVYVLNSKPDLGEINRIKVSTEKANLDDYAITSQYHFTIVSISNGVVLFETKKTSSMSYEERINQAITNYHTIIDYNPDGMVIGKIIIYTGDALYGNRFVRLTIIAISFFVITSLMIVYYIYMRIFLYRPFRKLKGFAQNIAHGNFDIGLPMDKNNLFGEFTESFDIMRTELKIARQKAVDEEISKKELIATLSHDIKTPISIIRAASELLEIGELDEKKLLNIKAIQAKTYEMDTLITDLFSSALEDLAELKINLKDLESKLLANIIHHFDPLKKITIERQIPECLIRVDPLRISQIFGNIISNSYKYANTPINVSSIIIDNYLKISFKDYGISLDDEDLPLIAHKFYRGKNTEGKQGVGLGLYICNELIKRMDGSLDFEIEKDGFRVDVSLKLS